MKNTENSRLPEAEFSLKEGSFRRIVETIQDVIFVNDYRGNFLYMNPVSFKVLGYSPDEIYSMNYIDIFPEEYKKLAFSIYSRQMKDKVEKTYQEIPVLCKDKTVRWFGQSVIRVEIEEGVFFCGLARDITDRLKIEDALRESEEKYRSILETMEEGFFEVNLRGDFVFFNKSLCKLIGRFTMDEIMAMNYKEVMDISNAGHVFQEFNSVYLTGKSKEVKFSIYNSSNEERKIETLISPIAGIDNNITGFRGIVRDVTEKEKILEELKNSLSKIEKNERKYRLLAENSTDLIWVLDRKTLKFSYISPAIEKVRGLSVEDALRENLNEIFPQDEMVMVLNLLKEELENDKPGLYDPGRRITFETRQYKKDGTMIWVEITAKFIRDNDGEIIAVQGSTRDISHRKQVEQERDRFAENLAAARLVQQEILPQRTPSSDLMDIEYRYLTIAEVGGDYFTFVDFREHESLGIFIGDVSGHGVPAALYTMMVKAITDRLFRKYNLNPSRFLEELNNEIHRAMTKHFLTGIYGFFSYGDQPGSVNFNFSKGGHPYPVYYSRSRRGAEYLESTGKALGFFGAEKYPNMTFTMSRGDRIYFYTDGLIEVTDKHKEIYGFERFLDLVNEVNVRDISLNESLDYILKAVINFNPQYEQEDDMVIIGMEVR
jgi:PAS domain S-box-containing protein